MGRLMPWFNPNLRGSSHGIFPASHPHASSQTAEEIGIEDIRDAMLALIAGIEGDRSPHVTRRIRYAGDVQALWFLRGDLMAVLAGSHGETTAREMLGGGSDLFQDLLPHGLGSRPS